MREQESPGNNFLRTARRTPGSAPQREKGLPNSMDWPILFTIPEMRRDRSGREPPQGACYVSTAPSELRYVVAGVFR